MKKESDLEHLPGYELYKAGMDAILKGNFDTAPAQFLLIARTRLSEAGFLLKPHSQSVPAHLHFYRLLAEKYPDAHYRYNASIQRLDKFCRAVERLAA